MGPYGGGELGCHPCLRGGGSGCSDLCVDGSGAQQTYKSGINGGSGTASEFR